MVENAQVRILLRVKDSGDGDAEVGDRAPEICGNCQSSAALISVNLPVWAERRRCVRVEQT